MRFIHAAGFVRDPAIEDHGIEAITCEARRYLIAGGTLTLGDWHEFSDAEQEAFRRAGDQIRADEIYRLAASVSDPKRAALDYARVDGGASYLELMLDEHSG